MKEFNEFLENNSHLSKHTLRSYHKNINDMLNYFEINTIQDYQALSLLDFEKYIKWLSEQKPERSGHDSSEIQVKASTINARLRCMKVFSSWLYRHELISIDHVAKIAFRKETAPVVIALTEEERQKMIASAPSLVHKLSLSLMLYMGVRREELTKIKVSDIVGNKLALLGKGKKMVMLDMPPVVTILLNQYLKLRKSNSEYLILSKVNPHPVTPDSVLKLVKHVAEKSNIPAEKLKFTSPHTLRRTYACAASASGVPRSVIQGMMRHSSPRTTDRYLDAMGPEYANKAIMNQPMPDMEALVWKTL